MIDSTNILILSCGSRNKIVQYFKRELGDKGLVMATDSSELAPALYEADKHFIVPRIDDEKYLDIIIKICKKNNIKGIFSLIDPELSLLAKNKERFLEIGTVPIVSNYEIVELSFDKYKFFEFLTKSGIKTIKSYIDKEKFYEDMSKNIISYPVFVKPVKGSASININKVYSNEELDKLFLNYENLMIQEFIDGKEYGVDVYIDINNAVPVTIFAKEKIKMRAGETDKSVSINDENIFTFIKEFLNTINYKGIIDIDLFRVNGEYYVSEVNPRFGGGYPHAYECGVNIPKMIIKNLLGEVNDIDIGNYKENIYMMKYSEVQILEF